MILPRILVIDDQYATQADMRGSLCYQCGLVKLNLKTSDHELESLAESEDVIAGAVFASGQKKKGTSVENSIEEVLKIVKAGWPSNHGWRWALILLDVKFDSIPSRYGDDTFGLKILEELVRHWPDRKAQPGNSELPIVMLSTISREKRETQANQAGASEYVEKDELVRSRLLELLDEYGLIGDTDGEIIGRSHALLRTLREARRVARMRSGNALILGPQGSGKSSIARYIHKQSRRTGSFVPFFSTPSAEQLEYPALFGYWYGAHSTATESAGGKAEEAHEGTLLIDEVHNLKNDSQQELLQFGRLEGGQRWLRRLGNFPTSPDRVVEQARRSVRGDRDPSTSRIAVDVLLLTATNEPLDDPSWRTANGFSEPLYTRLAIEYAERPLRFPSLADRWEDIPTLFKFFLEQETRNIGGRANSDGTKTLDPEVIGRLKEYSWPGNVAEMKGVALAVARNSRAFTDIFLRHLPPLDKRENTPLLLPPALPPELASNNLADAERALRSVQVPRSLVDLQGRLATLHNAYGQLVKEMLEVALDQTKIARSADDLCLPALRLLFGSEISTTTQAYSKLLSLSKLFLDNSPPSPGSLLDITLKRASANRNPGGRKNRIGGEDA